MTFAQNKASLNTLRWKSGLVQASHNLTFEDVSRVFSSYERRLMRKKKVKPGFDFLGLLHPKYPVDKIIKHLPDKVDIGFLDWTFGLDTTNLEKLLASGKVNRVRVHMMNSVCARNKDCCSPDWRGTKSQLNDAINHGMFDKRFSERIVLFRTLAEKYAGTHNSKSWFISPLLEHDQGEKAWKRLATIILVLWPNAILVNNPHTGWNGSYRFSFKETHNSSSWGDCSSLDGFGNGDGLFAMSESERDHWRDSTDHHVYRLSWIAAANFRKSGDGKPCPPKRKNCLDEETIKKWIEKTYN